MDGKTCKDCSGGIHWYADANHAECGWYHDKLTDVMDCPGQGDILPAETAEV